MAILLIISTGGLTYLNEMDSIIPQVEAKALPPPDLDNLLWNQTYGRFTDLVYLFAEHTFLFPNFNFNLILAEPRYQEIHIYIDDIIGNDSLN